MALALLGPFSLRLTLFVAVRLSVINLEQEQ
jgi:hypothetical protein